MCHVSRISAAKITLPASFLLTPLFPGTTSLSYCNTGGSQRVSQCCMLPPLLTSHVFSLTALTLSTCRLIMLISDKHFLYFLFIATTYIHMMFTCLFYGAVTISNGFLPVSQHLPACIHLYNMLSPSVHSFCSPLCDALG